jgi:1,4-dihydroxy-2-naphthoyl-CoA hydrolase
VPEPDTAGPREHQRDFTCRLSLGMSSVDRAGVLFYPELFRHAHDAYEALMASLDEGLGAYFEPGRPAIPIVHAEADYQRPMRHGNEFRVHLSVAQLGDSSMTLAYEFLGDDGKSCARAQTVHVFIDPDKGRPVPIPAELRAKLQRYTSTPSTS